MKKHNSQDGLRDASVELRQVTSQARLLLEERPTITEVKELRGLRQQLIAGLARYQELVHQLLEDLPDAEDPVLRADAIDLKVRAITLARAYEQFRDRWIEREFAEYWPEYRLSALPMIQNIHTCIEPAERMASRGSSSANLI